MKLTLWIVVTTALIFPHGPTLAAEKNAPEVPRVADERLTIELFAAAPDIVQPISMDFDHRGRLLVIESHTHFRPPNYKGPKHDRILAFDVNLSASKAARSIVFYEGTTATMDIAVHPDGSVYLATRSEILRLRDTDGGGKANEAQRVVFLDTKGNYPHNGLSGLCFDSKGNLYFGMGENLGADYKLIGTDGVTLVGGGEGGNVFHCTADGKKLRRVATGFWNPFGLGRDIFGRLFCVDNDPDAMPPCRMVHVVEGGDYGFQFRYGRAGRHVFQAWDGELPGTLPMMTGVGEAPCEILSYESDGLPKEYLGNLLVSSWADHRVERYKVKERGASFAAERVPFVQGGKDFRPVGLAVAPDGSLFVSDWVLSDYNLHGRGAIWHIHAKETRKAERPSDPHKALLSVHRPLRESAARQLAASEVGREFLRKQLTGADVRVRAASLTALLDIDDRHLDFLTLIDRNTEPGILALAVRALVARRDADDHSGVDIRRFLDKKQAAEVRFHAIPQLTSREYLGQLLALLSDADPFLQTGAIHQLARFPKLFEFISLPSSIKDSKSRTGWLLAARASASPEGAELLPTFLADPDEEVRFLAAKWVSDEKLTKHRKLIVEALKDPKLNVRMYQAYSTALARLDGQEVNEGKLADFFVSKLLDPTAPADVRVKSMQMVPATHGKLTTDLLSRLIAQEEPGLRLEAVRALAEHPSPKRYDLLWSVARNDKLPEGLRAQALVGLAEKSQDFIDELLRFVEADSAGLREEALRDLVDTKLSTGQRDRLEAVAKKHPEITAPVARALGKPMTAGRPRLEDTAAWLKLLEGPADESAGRRIFAHPRLAVCARCHRIEGRGGEIGPELGAVGRAGLKHIVESILQPSAVVAPRYQAWQIETADGKVRTGMLMRTNLDEYTYADEKGNSFKVNTRDVDMAKPLPTSIMPLGLTDRLTNQELRDLVAYLNARR